MNIITQFDHYLDESSPAALVVREHLMPVEGEDAVIFPATYAEIGYNIDKHPAGDIVLIDSVGSQANRIEPIFSEPAYSKLVPHVKIVAGTKEVSLLEASHRAGDAIVRCSELQNDLFAAFNASLNGDDSLLARIAPTSLIFGVWDSRETQAKKPRLISSTIRGYGVRELKRSAQFTPTIDYTVAGLEEPTDLRDKDGKAKGKHPFAQRGFTHVPATQTHGGVIANGGIRRDATLALAALRLLHAGSDSAATLKLRRYILGLSLVAFTRLPAGYLRQGTILVLNPDKPREFVEVMPDGKRIPSVITHEQALAYAHTAAEAFGVGKDRKEHFSAALAKADLKKKEKAT